MTRAFDSGQYSVCGGVYFSSELFAQSRPMSFSDKYLQILCTALAVAMTIVAAANWLNRKHGGFD